MENITEQEIIQKVKQFTQIHPDFGFTITELNIERFAEDLVKKLTIPVVVGQSEQLVCSCGSIKVRTNSGTQCPNNRCSSAN
jgi:hypothetical protein